MNRLVEYLNCGGIRVNNNKSAAYFTVTKFSDVLEKIIPFFKKYPLQGGKTLRF